MTLDKHEKRWAAYVALAILAIIIFLFVRRGQQVAAAAPVQLGAATPATSPIFFSTTPGIPDSALAYNGQPNAVDTLADLYINDTGPGYVSNGYLPLFGLVGFGSSPGAY
jgi:hypothetical protein